MRADRIGLEVEDDGEEIRIRLRGEFDHTHLAAITEKLGLLAEGPGRIWFLDLEQARFRSPAYLETMLDLLERIRAKQGRMVMLFDNKENWAFFRRYAHVFSIHNNREDFQRSGFLRRLRQLGIYSSRRTGIRLTPGVSILLAIVFMGWLLTLFSMIRFQEEEIRLREQMVLELETDLRKSQQELIELRTAIGPLRDLGLLRDTVSGNELRNLGDWVEYLERMETRRRAGKTDSLP